MALTHALSTNNYGPAHLIVATSAANGTHTTLAGAMADAVSGDTIFLRDSVSETVTLTAGVNIAAWTGGTLNVPSITGKLTMTTAGTCNISGIRLVTNSDFVLAVTGSANSIVNLNNCYLNCSNNTGISFTTSGASSAINCYYCTSDMGTTGIAPFAHSAAGTLVFESCRFSNSGGSTTASTASSGNTIILRSTFGNPITTSGTAGITLRHSEIEPSGNTTAFTCGGSGTNEAIHSRFSGGTASAISVGGTLEAYNLTVISTNANSITGAGTINYSGIFFTAGTTQVINTSTKNQRNAMTGSISFDNGTNYLSNYAEGTWTPTITPSGTAFTSITYSSQVGSYVRVGNMVTVFCSVSLSALTLGAATGSVRISALPFTSNSLANQTYSGTVGASVVTFAGNYLYGALSPSSTNVNIQIVGTAAGLSNLPVAGLAATSAFNMTITYRI